MMQTDIFTYKALDLIRLFNSRKMLPVDLGLTFEEPISLTCSDLERISDQLSIPFSDLVKLSENETNDLTDRVKVSRKTSLYERKASKNGIDSYHYRHVLKTSADFNFMALRTSPLYENQVYLNDGHATKEFVYVLNGSVRMYWQKGTGPTRDVVLSEGDSVYIEPWVKHAFAKIEEQSEILAVDFI